MRINKTPEYERVIKEPAQFNAEGRHVRVNVVGDNTSVAFTCRNFGQAGYVMTRQEFFDLVKEMKEIEEKLIEG